MARGSDTPLARHGIPVLIDGSSPHVYLFTLRQQHDHLPADARR